MALKRITDYPAAATPLAGTEALELDVAGVPAKTTAKDVANTAFGATSTSATAGAATALPAQPAGYVEVVIGGVVKKLPYYD